MNEIRFQEQPSALPQEGWPPHPKAPPERTCLQGDVRNMLWAEYHLTGRREPGTLCTTEPRAYHSSSCC